ncbi:hypothetical protein [Lonsdalea quercina]|uniref:hypothetical protein n=1 Tax=Lonsdalea quercina TaxID=71657 RepID=UPI0039761382
MMMDKKNNSFMLVVQDSKEWELMWASLSLLPENSELPEPSSAENFGEVWEYMETTKSRFLEKYYHRFRHRMHPVKGVNYQIKIKASKDFSSEDYVINKW